MEQHKFQEDVIARLTAIEVNLAEHMRRTNIAEGRLGSLERTSYMQMGAYALLAFITSLGGMYVFIK